MEDGGSAKSALRQCVAGIVPCYNAGGRVRSVVENMRAVLDHVIVVNDGSTDGCIQSLEGLPVEILSFEKNRGKGHAILAGLKRALEYPECTACCLLDADGQHDPAEIPRLFERMVETGADLVIGARDFGAGRVPWRSRFGNRVTAWVAARLLGARLPDTQSCFRMLSRPFVEAVLASVAGGRYETEMEVIIRALRGGYRVESVPISTIYEEANRSSHFRKIRDSLRIYKRLMRAALKYPRQF